MFLATALAFGAVTMAAPPDYPEKVTIIPFEGGRYSDPHKGISARMYDLKGSPRFGLKCLHLYEPASKIVQADGTEWLIEKSMDAAPEVRCVVRKIPK